MARVDRYVQYAAGQGYDEILFRTEGGSVTVYLGPDLVPIDAVLSPHELQLLVREILPPGTEAPRQWGEIVTFNHDSPCGTVLVHLSACSGGSQVRACLCRGASERFGQVAAEQTDDDEDIVDMDGLFRLMVAQGASDLHLSCGQPPYIRVDGVMRPLDRFEDLEPEVLLRLFEPITPARNWMEWEACGDTDFAYEVPSVSRFRCNLFRDLWGPGGVFRAIPTEIPSAECLRLPPRVLDLCSLPKGLILVTGPTGSGKSTSLAAMIRHINQTRREHIVTIEDPIEYVHPNINCLINQREVGVHTESFAKALRAALREDPDVVLVGEMRDLETVAIALETAETGHLVLATLHTTTAASTIDRIIDQFPAPQQPQISMMLADTLRGVIAQTLLRRVMGGRVAAFELLVVTAAAASLIREGKTHQIPSVIQTGRQHGMVTMTDSLAALAAEGTVEPLEAYLKATDRDALLDAFRGSGVRFEPPAEDDILRV